jgi:hypothetical protein
MTNYICTACGTQFAETDAKPEACPICDDERQYVPGGVQQWTTLDELRAKHRNSFRLEEDGLMAIGTVPDFAIGPRAFLVRGEGATVLWDCIALVDDATVEIVRGLGAPFAIAISHPHYYTTCVEWSRALGGIPVYLHAADRQHVMRPDPAIRFWEGDAMELAPGLTLVRLGGHFAGGTVLHWADGSGGRGTLLSGDVLQVNPDGRTVGFMRSYPNHIPLAAAEVARIARAVGAYEFEAVHGAFWGRSIGSAGRDGVLRSAERYVAWVNAPAGEPDSADGSRASGS